MRKTKFAHAPLGLFQDNFIRDCLQFTRETTIVTTITVTMTTTTTTTTTRLNTKKCVTFINSTIVKTANNTAFKLIPFERQKMKNPLLGITAPLSGRKKNLHCNVYCVN